MVDCGCVGSLVVKYMLMVSIISRSCYNHKHDLGEKPFAFGGTVRVTGVVLLHPKSIVGSSSLSRTTYCQCSPCLTLA